ncbi:MAG TPA: sensor domain-containing diguanylate cyclase [Acidimicrobiales bacterium]|nr:sensor domain-containing diguanylate cyclase [Acidimicrobiales bacterium]
MDAGQADAADLLVFERLADAVVGIDELGGIRFLNQKMAAMLGIEPSEGVGRSVADFVHPDDLEAAAGSLVGLVAGSIGVEFTPIVFRLLHSSGAYVPMELNACPLLTEGPFAGWMFVIGRYPGDQILDRRAARMLTEGAPISEVVAIVPEYGKWRHPSQHYCVRFVDEGGEPAWIGSDPVIDLCRTYEAVDAPWEAASRSGMRVDCQFDSLPSELQAQAEARGLGGCSAVPVVDPLYPGTAMIIAWSTAGGPAPDVHHYTMDQMTGLLALATQWRLQVERLERAARYDALTGLVNRASFFDSLSSAADPGAGLLAGILYVDLDQFKEVNDRYGHGTGDQVLSVAARRMSGIVRDRDVLARLGGDEFAILCVPIHGTSEAVTIAERLLSALGEPIQIEGREVTIGASIGIALADPAQVPSGELLERADHAMYEAKASGRNIWRLAL